MDTRVSLSVGLKHGRLGGLSTSATVVRRRKSSAGAGATTSTAIPGQPGSGHFAGGVELPVTSRLDIVDPDNFPTWPVYSIIGKDGHVRPEAVEPYLSQEKSLKMYENMVRLETMDDILYGAQRQGRIAFYAQSAGEEVLQIAAAAALDAEDMVFTQYREPGVLMWRGFGLQGFADQCLGNEDDLSKGRQMPIHYGSRELNFQLSNANKISVCFFGDGAASEGDFHAALAVAATRDVPVLFICRNNGFAISTPVEEQYRGDGIVSRAPGYGIHGIRVDGNDALAMYEATTEARQICISKKKPVLLEAMTYRLGHHSTSDDSSRYRSSSEVAKRKEVTPIRRFYAYLEAKGWWDGERDKHLRDRERIAVLEALEVAERKAKPAFKALFEDVYKVMPSNLREQQEHLRSHLQRHRGEYNGT